MKKTSKKVSAKAEEYVPVEGSTEAAVSSAETEMVILPLSIDFNKEDLNTLVMKVNEIIMYLNNK